MAERDLWGSEQSPHLLRMAWIAEHVGIGPRPLSTRLLCPPLHQGGPETTREPPSLGSPASTDLTLRMTPKLCGRTKGQRTQAPVQSRGSGQLCKLGPRASCPSPMSCASYFMTVPLGWQAIHQPQDVHCAHSPWSHVSNPRQEEDYSTRKTRSQKALGFVHLIRSRRGASAQCRFQADGRS